MTAPLDSPYDVPNLSTSGPYYAQPPPSQSGETSTAALASLLQAELTQPSASDPTTDTSFSTASPSRHQSRKPNFDENSKKEGGYQHAAPSSLYSLENLLYGKGTQGQKRSFDQFRTPETPGQSPSGTATSDAADSGDGRNPKRKTNNQPKSVGRPRKADNELKRPRYRPREKPTRLRINKPLKADINEDVWRNIFRYTEPATLLTMRRVCRTFNTILTHEDFIWQENRRNVFGDDCPPPPPGLPAAAQASTESHGTTTPVSEGGEGEPGQLPKGVQRQYLDLLAGRNCMSCGARKTKKTLWAFLRRWCEKCYKSKTVPITSLMMARDRQHMLYFCIPRGLSDKWGSYKSVGVVSEREGPDYQPLSLLEHHVFLRSDVTKLLGEYDMFCESLSDQSAESANRMKQHWMSERRKAVDQRLKQCKEIEVFVDSIWEDVKDDERAIRAHYTKQRLDFFAEKASQLDPPVSKEVLEKIPALQKALKEPREPTNRAWMNLRSKIEQSRAAAEETVEFERSQEPASRSYPHKEESRRLDRNSESLPFILNIANEVIAELADTNIADVDLPLVALRRVWEIYNLEKAEEDLPRASDADMLSPSVERGPHVLSLHDALKVYETKVVSHMDKWGPIRSRTAQKLKCPGCSRVDYSKDWSFKALFRHLQERHGQELGSDWTSYHRAAVTYNCKSSFPYYALPWTRNLPILAQHQTATGRWDPDDESPYNHATSLTRSDISTPSAFAERNVRSSEDDKLSVRSLATWAVEATKLLRKTSLPRNYIALVAWNYMIRRGRAHPDAASPSVHNPLFRNETLKELVAEMMTLGEYSVFDGYACIACNEVGRVRGGSSATTINFGLKGHPFGDLIQHWLGWHTSGRVSLVRIHDSDEEDEAKARDKWPDDLLFLPAEGELTEVLRTAGMEEAREVFEWLFPIEAGALNVLRDPNVFVNRPELGTSVTSSTSPALQQERQVLDDVEHAVDTKPQQNLLDGIIGLSEPSHSSGNQSDIQTVRPTLTGTMTESSGLDLLADSALRDELRLRARVASEKDTEGITRNGEAEVGPEQEEDMMAGW